MQTMLRIIALTAAVMLVTLTCPEAAPGGAAQPPTKVLEKEHGIISRIAAQAGEEADALRRSGKPDMERIAKMHDFFVNFADACHHAKEESELFPALRDHDVDPVIIDLLLKQHEEGRVLLAGVERELSKARTPDTTIDTDRLSRYLDEYSLLMARHIATENDYLWPKARTAMSQQEQQKLSKAFHHIETEELDEGFHEKYHAMAMDLLGESGD